MRPFLVLLLASLFALGVSFSANSSVPYKSYKPVGQANLKVLFWNIYTAYLYTPSGTYEDMEQPLALRIVYHRDIDKKDLSDNTLDQWQTLFGERDAYKSWLMELNAIWPDLKEGDELSVMQNKGECQFYQKEAFLGAVTNQELCQSFIAIWLSENTSRPKLRKQLIGR